MDELEDLENVTLQKNDNSKNNEGTAKVLLIIFLVVLIVALGLFFLRKMNSTTAYNNGLVNPEISSTNYSAPVVPENRDSREIARPSTAISEPMITEVQNQNIPVEETAPIAAYTQA
ncbi:MAG: hypothetical protein ACRCSK_06720, partial [Fusobacteriaceae bacterium]